jgi:benzoyl-CoA reductase subunit D
MSLVTAGIDVGTSAVKIALLRVSGSEATILAHGTERIRRREPRAVVERAWSQALEAASLGARDVAYVASTGEGHLVENRTGHFYGMTTHARGGGWLVPGVGGVVDVGALHARAIRVDARCRVLGYRMTSQCASGTGQFVENIARYLGVTLEEVGPLSLEATAPERVSGICAVLAETDVINMVSRGIARPDILAGIHLSMADRLAKLVRSAGIEGRVLLTGGLAADVGLVRALSQGIASDGKRPIEIVTHPDAVLAGALGAALWGAVRHEKLSRRRIAVEETA